MKQNLALMMLLMTTLLLADYKAKISSITSEIKQRMIKGHSWRRGCPVPLEELYAIGYPIRKMKLVSDYKGSDWQSIEADNSSAFNCRNATGFKKWSKHSYGKAIDLNSIENPYISRSGHIFL